MKRTTLFSVCSALIAFGVIGVAGYGCGDDDDNPVTPKPDAPITTPETSTPDTSMPDTGPVKPAIPTLGAQIDRMGRPAIATALISNFEGDAGAKGTARDNYNKDTSGPAALQAAYSAAMGGHLAIYDSLDSNVVPGDGCGNQLLAKDGGLASANSNAQVYGGLAAALADDRVWLNTAGATATQYLAVEANATMVIPNADRGGRTLAYDVIDVTYSAVAIGNVTGVGDGIAADPAKTGGTTFPYLVGP